MKKTLETMEIPGLVFTNSRDGPDGVGRGVDGPGNHPVGEALVHHHGAEVADIGHRVPRHVPGNTLVLAHLIIGIGKGRQQFRGLGIHDPGTFQREPEGRGLLPHLLLVAEQGDVADVPEQHDLRGPEDALFGALGQHDVFTLLFRLSDQFVLEHERRDPLRARHGHPVQKTGQVHGRLHQPERGRDLPLVLRREGRPHTVDAHGRREGVHFSAQHRHRRDAQSFDQPL